MARRGVDAGGMDRSRIRIGNLGRLAAGAAGAGVLLLVLPGLLRAPEPPPAPADVGLAPAEAAPEARPSSREANRVRPGDSEHEPPRRGRGRRQAKPGGERAPRSGNRGRRSADDREPRPGPSAPATAAAPPQPSPPPPAPAPVGAPAASAPATDAASERGPAPRRPAGRSEFGFER